MNRALFLDRDGVINEDYGYVHKAQEFHFRDGIFDVCNAAQEARMKIIVVTNQAGIGRGIYTLDDFYRLTDYMLKEFKFRKISISGVYHCPYHPTDGIGHFRKQSFCRKPNAGMFVAACSDHNINPRMSVMIGDKKSDEMAAASAGVVYFISSLASGWAHAAIKTIASLD